jgi:hypothetical protein
MSVCEPLSDARPWKRYPWSKMEVGDSFIDPARSVNTVRCAAYQAGVRLKAKFSLHRMADSILVTRIA